MAPATPAQKRATVKHRAARRRIELLLDPESPEAKALDRLAAIHGSTAAAVRVALLAAVAETGKARVARPAKPTTPEPSSAGRRENPKPGALDLPLGPPPSVPGSRLIDKKPRR